ncbi:Tmem248 [Columba guinea]|nr:Tmem248 [Columba guinea]
MRQLLHIWLLIRLDLLAVKDPSFAGFVDIPSVKNNISASEISGTHKEVVIVYIVVNNQNNVQHKPVGEPEGLYQQSTSACGLYDQCKRYGNSFSDTGLFLQNQGDQVTRNDRALLCNEGNLAGNRSCPERGENAPDWNTFLLRFNDLDFCISENETLKHLINDTTTPESTVTSGQARSSTQSPQTLEDSGPINISVTITLTLDPLRPFGGYSRNVTHLSSTIFGHQIGLSGRESHEEINITFTLPAAWNSDDCVLHGHCEQVVFTTCMTITAASNVFPVTVQPPHCVPETYSNATLWYKIFTTARDSNTKYAQDYNPFWCYKGAIGKVYHALNPKLTVIVPDDDRSLINLHLMHTSYFLFVMVITMFCYAVIKGRPSKLRQSNTEFCSEKVALSEA